MARCRTLATLGVLPFGLVRSLDVQGLERVDTAPVRIEAVAPRVTVVFEGIVFDPHGAPAEGAVVVSSAGGKAITDRSGKYRLEVGVPAEAQGVQITAVGGVGGQLVAKRSVSLPARSRFAQMQPLELTQESTCQPSWLPTFGGEPGTDESVVALAVFNDGSGPALYAGGGFTEAGGVRVNDIAKWDGSRWAALGSGMDGGAFFTSVDALTVFDDGSGAALYAGGRFNTAGGVLTNNVATWDGSSWAALGSGTGAALSGLPSVSALAVFDDGSGPALYAGGNFTTAGGTGARHIAKWDGSSWAALGSGTSAAVASTPAPVRALAVFDDGSGPALYAGGEFTTAGGVAANGIAKWNGSTWAPVGVGVGGAGTTNVLALTVFDNGGGPALYAGGFFPTAGGVVANHIARWNGWTWTALSSGMANVPGPFAFVAALTTFDDGSGPALHAVGYFTTAGGVAANGIAKWDGSSWSALGNGLTGILTQVFALAVFDEGSGPVLFAGGIITTAGSVSARNIAKWDASSWAVVGRGMTGSVDALAVFDDGSGPALYAGGAFTMAGGVVTNNIAKWNGSTWTPLGSGTNDAVAALAVYDDGNGPALYAGGAFGNAGGLLARRIARWDGSSWAALGSGMNTAVHALAVFDDGGGPALYAAGTFVTAGGVPANRLAKWDGASWAALGSGVLGVVNALAVFDGGGGPALYAGGSFSTAGGSAANRIARWDGASWAALGSGMNFPVHALKEFDEDSGPALYAGGTFTTAGGVAASCIAKWDGSSWTPLGVGVSETSSAPRVSALTVFDDGSGSALYAGGRFTTAGGVAANQIAKWDGSCWAPLGGGVGGRLLPEVNALTVFNDRTGLALHAGGSFTTAFDSGDAYLAKWGCPDTTSPVIACPSSIVVDDRPESLPGEVLTFLVTAVDEEDPTPDLVCSPPSGSRFPRGTTLVLCTATDASGNQATCQFRITVGAKVPEIR